MYQIEIVAHQVKGQISFSDGVEAPGGSSREVKDFRDRAVDKLEEVVLVAGYSDILMTFYHLNKFRCCHLPLLGKHMINVMIL